MKLFLLILAIIPVRTSSASFKKRKANLTAVISRENNPYNLQRCLQRRKVIVIISGAFIGLSTMPSVLSPQRQRRGSCQKRCRAVTIRGILAKMIAGVSFIAPTCKKTGGISRKRRTPHCFVRNSVATLPDVSSRSDENEIESRR